MIRVTIVAPSMAIRAGIRTLLMEDLTIDIIWESSSLEDMDGGKGEADVLIWSPAAAWDEDTLHSQLANFKEAATALLIIHDNPALVEKIANLKYLAWGYISTESPQAEIIAAIHALHEGLVVINPILLPYLDGRHAPGLAENNDMVENLTGREVEILQLLALGLTNKQIAVRLGISMHTVKFHVSSIFGKMGTTNRTETVQLGLKRGLILL